MATSTKKKASSRSTPAKKGGSRAPAAKKTSGSRSGSARPGSAEQSAMDAERIREIWGVVLVVVAVLSGLGLWVQDSAGLVGIVLVNVFRGLFGVFGLVIPVLIAVGAVLLLREARPRNPRLVGGAAIILLSVMGLWHLASGTPGMEASAQQLHAAGGWIGMGVSLPLQTVAALPGAVVVLVGTLAIGLLVMTATPLRLAAHAVTTVFLSDEPRQRTSSSRRIGLPGRRSRTAAAPTPTGEGADYVEDFAEEGVAQVGVAGADPAEDEGAMSHAAGSRGRSDVDETVDIRDVTDPRVLLDIPLDGDEEAAPNRPAAREETLRAPSGAADPSSAADVDTVHLDRGDADAAERADLAGEAPGETAIARPDFIVGHQGGLARKLVQNPDVVYKLPPLDMLRTGRAANGNTADMESMTEALETMLREFGVDARVVAVRRGPTVTRFEIELGTGVKVAAITKLEKDIAYALATPDIRIVAPIPGKVAIGIEVPNAERDLITLGDVLRSPEAAAQTHPLTAGIGADISGKPVTVNLAKMPHLLIAGATGSGKSVVMNSIVTSLIMRNTPDEVRMILIDPKRVEMTTYEDVPHLLTRVVTDPKRAKDALDWAVSEMERRYDLLARYGFRGIDRFNEYARDGRLVGGDVVDPPQTEDGQLIMPESRDTAGDQTDDGLGDADLLEDGLDPMADGARPEGPEAEQPLPFIVLIIDELADLMMVAPRDIESAIVRIAQMARAVGIHMILATQRPSVNVVTGLIKANVPSRMALSMATGHDSKTILDQHGAEKLVGQGDMLYMPANASKPHRLQGCLIEETEIEKIVEHCKAQTEVTYEENVVKEGKEAVMADVQGDDASDEQLTRAAMELVVRSGLGSTSMLQRKLKVGFARAGRLMDELEEAGVVGPSEGPKARTVYMTVDQLESGEMPVA